MIRLLLVLLSSSGIAGTPLHFSSPMIPGLEKHAEIFEHPAALYQMGEFLKLGIAGHGKAEFQSTAQVKLLRDTYPEAAFGIKFVRRVDDRFRYEAFAEWTLFFKTRMKAEITLQLATNQVDLWIAFPLSHLMPNEVTERLGRAIERATRIGIQQRLLEYLATLPIDKKERLAKISSDYDEWLAQRTVAEGSPLQNPYEDPRLKKVMAWVAAFLLVGLILRSARNLRESLRW